MAYFTLILIFVALWLAIYLSRADLRRSIVLVSLVIAPLGPISEHWFLRDYWVRDTLTGAAIGAEDLLFGFFLGGVTFAIYKFLFRLRASKTENSTPRPYIAVSAACILISALFVLTDVYGMNSIFSSAIGFCIVTAIIWLLRPDLAKPSLISGILSVIIFASAYLIVEGLFPGTLQKWCLECNPTQIRILGINIEELIWDFTWGLLGSVIIEAVTGRHLVQSRRSQ